MIGIYQIYNIKNGKRYIGSSIDVERRWKAHVAELQGSRHPNEHLQRSWIKYGSKAFELGNLLICIPEDMLIYEQWFLDNWKPEYNMCLVVGSRLGREHTKETKEKLSKAHIGKKHTEETKAKMSKAKQGNTIWIGRKHTAESKKKMSESAKRRWQRAPL